jgi:RHS repeat-associated protein
MFREYRNVTPYRFNGKELDTETGLYYYGARYYNPATALWLGVDPLASKYPGVSPYVYCVSNPIKYVDPDGRDWYESENRDIKWTECKSQVELDDARINGTYLAEAFILFEGSEDERLGKGDNLFGEGAILASVTVYGSQNETDIESYEGYSMSSDPSLFGVVADGDYKISRLPADERRGPFNSDLVIESRNAKIPARGGVNPAYPSRTPGYLTGVFIHRSNNDGRAGTYNKDGKTKGISEGCLLILPNQWNKFVKQLSSAKNMKLRLIR